MQPYRHAYRHSDWGAIGRSNTVAKSSPDVKAQLGADAGANEGAQSGPDVKAQLGADAGANEGAQWRAHTIAIFESYVPAFEISDPSTNEGTYFSAIIVTIENTDSASVAESNTESDRGSIVASHSRTVDVAVKHPLPCTNQSAIVNAMADRGSDS